MIVIRQQPFDSHLVASLFQMFRILRKCIFSSGKTRSDPEALVHYKLYLFLLINQKINVDLSELCQEEEEKVFPSLALTIHCCHIYSTFYTVLPCIIYQFSTTPNVQNLNKYYYLFIENIYIKGISNKKKIINLFISIIINNISSQTCNFFFIFDFQKLNGFVYLNKILQHCGWHCILLEYYKKSCLEMKYLF